MQKDIRAYALACEPGYAEMDFNYVSHEAGLEHPFALAQHDQKSIRASNH